MAEIMLEQNLEGFSDDREALGEAIVKMQKSLSWLLAHLDSRNVQSINTNLTKIASADGATTLNGSQLLMCDASGRLRAALGRSEGGGLAVGRDGSGKALADGDDLLLRLDIFAHRFQ